MYIFENINQSLIGMSKELLKNGVKRTTRGFNCVELPHPITIKITNPCDRHITISGRKQNKYLPFVETLWLMLGINDLEMPGDYVHNLYSYSDDKKYMRAGYSPRIRCFNGNLRDYEVSTIKDKFDQRKLFGYTDQLKYVIDSLKRDINTRQCVIEIGDPNKDCYDESGKLKVTKDYPCTRLLNFQVREGKLDLTVYMRSNDHIFGAHGVNITNFTLIQEIVASTINLPVGDYYHVVNNYHYYDNFEYRVKSFANFNLEDYQTIAPFYYNDSFKDLKDFDVWMNTIYSYERSLRGEIVKDQLPKSGKDMINDWAGVFYHKWTGNHFEFKNPYLNILFYGK